MTDDPLAVDAETMRCLGYRVVDMLVERSTRTDTAPLRRATPAEMRERLHGPPPGEPQELDTILAQLERDVLPFLSDVGHPASFAFIPGSGTWPAALGDLIASALNLYAGSWMESAGPSQLELEVLGWFKEWIGYPEDAGGTLVGGGSAANMTAIACAREALAGAMTGDLVAYVSDQAHSSLARAARVLGFRPEQVRVLPVDGSFRLDPRTVAAAMDADVRAGRRPLVLSASGGSTNTGSVDPLRELAELCRERGVWLHVDAAYGGFATLTERGREVLDGLGLADSVTLDPHKWLYQPYECGCLLVREGRRLREAFAITPDYLRDADATDADTEVNFTDLGLQLTRSSRALKVWISLRYFGVGAFRDAVDRSLDLAELASSRIESSATLEPMAPPSLGIVCFRRRFEGVEDESELERRNATLAAALEESGVGLVSSTRLRGTYALRMCILNHTSAREDVERVLEFLETAEPAAKAAAAPAVRERHPDITGTWLATAGPEAEALRRLPLFESLRPDELLHVARLAEPREAPAGEPVVERWESSRDFFVVVEGSVEVLVDGERVAELGPGDFFGELAALDWGAGFGYPRLATVAAISPLRLLVFPDGMLNELVRAYPAVETRIRAAARERLSRLEP